MEEERFYTEPREIESSFVSNNQDFNGGSALQIRLDTQKLLQQIEFFLRGKEENYFVDEKTGAVVPRIVNLGIPKANTNGIQGMLNSCRSLINSSVVQGNYDKNDYKNFIAEKREELVELLLVNMYDWELSSEGVINEIIDFIMNIVEPFLSRTIDNLERDSYNHKITDRGAEPQKSKWGFM